MMELGGKRVLIVEDEAMLSIELQDLLQDLGCVVVGAAGRFEQAQKMASELSFDVAVLDVNLGRKSAIPIADTIASRHLPFVFATGYGPGGAIEQFSAPVIEKPYDGNNLRRALTEALWSEND